MGKPAIVLPPVIPDYELIREIGKGSYGEVWLARTQLGMYRAVKVVGGEREIAGLRRFEPISRTHEGLVAILHIGRSPGKEYFYYVMELGDDRVDGAAINPATYMPKTLATDAKQRGRLPAQECVELGIALTKALQEIHRNGLVHRDIKPSNVIFVKGKPKLADVGLVTNLSQANSYVGTEGFIAPEGPGSPQGDIYSLGKLLYEISTGKDRTEFPILPPDLPDSKEFLELNEVLVKACHGDRAQRYQTAAAMEADLTLLGSGESVRRLRALERLLARLKKIAVAACIVMGLLILAYLQINYRAKKVAEIRQLQLGGHLAEGTHALNRGDYAGALSHFLSPYIIEARDPKRTRAHQLRLRAILDRCPKLEQVFFHDAQVVDQAQFSSDEKLVLTSVSFGTAQVWDVSTGERIAGPFPAGTALESASLSFDAQYVLTADQQGLAKVWNRSTGTLVTSVRHPGQFLSFARFSPGMDQIITVGDRGVACLWDFPSGRPAQTLSNHTGVILYAGYSRGGSRLVTTGRDGKATVWDAATFALLHQFGHKQWVYHADFSPDGRLLVTASSDRQARIWDLASGEQVQPPMPHGDDVYTARFSPDGRSIVTACLDGMARLWDVMTRQLVAVNPLLHHGDRVMDASFSADGRRILTACADGTARIWDLAGSVGTAMTATNFYSADGSLVELGRLRKALPELSVKSLALPSTNHTFPKHSLSRNGKFLLELRANGSVSQIQAWDISRLEPVSAVITVGATNLDLSGCVTEDGRHGLIYSRKAATLHDLTRSKQMQMTLSGGLTMVGAAFSADGRYVVIYGSSIAHVTEVETGKALPLLKYDEKVRYADFSPDSQKLVVCVKGSGLEKLFAELWFPATGSKKRLPHGDGVLTASFSADSRWVVTASEDFYASIWDSANGRQTTPSLLHEDKVMFASFSHHGEWLVTASDDGNVRLWDATTRKPLTPPLPLPGFPHRVRFVADDSAVFLTNEDGEAWLWPLARETRSAEDLMWLYELVSGRSDFEANRFRTSSQALLKEKWLQFKKDHSQDFKTSKAEILAWHRREADQAKANQQTDAETFHLKILSNSTP